MTQENVQKAPEDKTVGKALPVKEPEQKTPDLPRDPLHTVIGATIFTATVFVI